LVLISCGGCAGKLFQPVPPLFKTWARAGTAPDQVKEALLDCGYDNPYTGFETHLITVEKIAAADRCMERLGFKYLVGTPICEQPGSDRILACR
jgi:hypothetical protein